MARAPRIIVVGGTERQRAEVAEVLAGAGIDHVATGMVQEVVAATGPLPDLLIAVGGDPAEVCRDIRDESALSQVAVLALVKRMPREAAIAALGSGADEVIEDPPLPAILGARVRTLVRTSGERRRARALDAAQVALLEVTRLVAAGGDAPEVLREVMQVAVRAMGFDRASLVAHVEGWERAYVIAATDDPSMSQFSLDAASYPEVVKATRAGEPVLVSDIYSDPVTAPVAAGLAGADIGALAVFPIRWRGRGLGVVSFRKRDPGLEHLSAEQMAFGNLFAHHAAVVLRDDRVIEGLRDRTGRFSRAGYEAERRLRTIDSLKEYFEAAADGVVVLDDEGRILFVNHTAEAITGFARDGLIGTALVDLVASPQRDALEGVIRNVLGGTNIEAFDIDIATTTGGSICASVTTSTVLSQSGAVILSFRDVTSERALEEELRKTKDFLERLIDSTVDAIVAADIRGNVILFNRGAERIYGYRPEEAIGNIPVWNLYPDGVAKQLMRMLRSTSYGGVGRLEQTRREILTRSGEVVPVNLTASIIYEGEREVASVGIFSDLRERIRIEQRLLQAQEKLEVSQKQAVVAELAGAAAHELNQPLTSIMGYAQLIERQSDEDAPHNRAVQVILAEAERMAELVKKIGRITKFETKEYVGSASILDLDKSAAAGAPRAGVTGLTRSAGTGARAARGDRVRSQAEDDEPTRRIEIGKGSRG